MVLGWEEEDEEIAGDISWRMRNGDGGNDEVTPACSWLDWFTKLLLTYLFINVYQGVFWSYCINYASSCSSNKESVGISLSEFLIYLFV